MISTIGNNKMYKVDPNDPKKSIPKQLAYDNPSSIAAFNTDAEAQVAANKRIATLAFENAKLEQTKSAREEVFILIIKSIVIKVDY